MVTYTEQLTIEISRLLAGEQSRRRNLNSFLPLVHQSYPSKSTNSYTQYILTTVIKHTVHQLTHFISIWLPFPFSYFVGKNITWLQLPHKKVCVFKNYMKLKMNPTVQVQEIMFHALPWIFAWKTTAIKFNLGLLWDPNYHYQQN